jgi:DNA primase
MEGYFDVISAQINGVKNTVASCGTALTPQQVKLLSRYTMSRKIYLAFDTDAAGIKATSSGADVIRNIFENLGDIKQYDSSYSDLSQSVCEIRVVSQVGGKDPDEYIREFGAQEYKKQVQNSPLLLDFQIEQAFKGVSKKPTAQEKNELVHQLVEILIQIKNPVILAEYIKNTAYKLNLEEKILKRQVDIALSTKNKPNITKDEDKIVDIRHQKSSFEETYSKVESNIIKLALSADTIEKRVYLKQSIQGFNPKDEMHIEIVTQIDKLLNKINNVSDIAKKLFAVFCSNSEIQKYLTDLIYRAREFENLSYDDFVQAIGETFEKLNNLNKIKSKNKIRQKYKNTDITEEEQMKISQEIYEQFGYRRN